MYYSFDKVAPGWNAERAGHLYSSLVGMVEDAKLQALMYPDQDERFRTVWVEMVRGNKDVIVAVRLRGITHLTDEECKALVQTASAIFQDVMETRQENGLETQRKTPTS